MVLYLPKFLVSFSLSYGRNDQAPVSFPGLRAICVYSYIYQTYLRPLLVTLHYIYFNTGVTFVVYHLGPKFLDFPGIYVFKEFENVKLTKKNV